MEKAATLSHPW